MLKDFICKYKHLRVGLPITCTNMFILNLYEHFHFEEKRKYILAFRDYTDFNMKPPDLRNL